ncbi:MAG: ABC transporter ATP-binding protein [Magnetovibrio sp.]|nr:ABC transporter ATP-binding protein [Magnetovibrio sp.]
MKENACGCAGCFTATNTLSILAEVFEQEGALDKLQAFASENGPHFYGLPVSDETVTLTRLDEAEIASLGIGRKFQKPTVFENHTVWDNLVLALKSGRRAWDTLFHITGAKDRKEIEDILEITRLTRVKDEVSANLSYGQKQWLEIGMLLAQDPKLLLVDEPVAGMTDAETEETARLLRDIAQRHSVVVVEHDMTFVRDLDVQVTVLHEGSAIAEGTLDYVSADERVIEVYLGR